MSAVALAPAVADLVAPAAPRHGASSDGDAFAAHLQSATGQASDSAPRGAAPQSDTPPSAGSSSGSSSTSEAAAADNATADVAPDPTTTSLSVSTSPAAPAPVAPTLTTPSLTAPHAPASARRGQHQAAAAAPSTLTLPTALSAVPQALPDAGAAAATAEPAATTEPQAELAPVAVAAVAATGVVLEAGATTAQPQATDDTTAVQAASTSAPAAAPASPSLVAPQPNVAKRADVTDVTDAKPAPVVSAPAVRVTSSVSTPTSAPVPDAHRASRQEEPANTVPLAVAAPATVATRVVQDAAPATAPAATPAAPLNTQLAPPILNLKSAAPGEHVLTITVSPESIGAVTVRAHVSGDHLRVELTSPTDQGRDALKSMLPDLKRDLAQGGMSSALSVSPQATDANGSGVGAGTNPFAGSGSEGFGGRETRQNSATASRDSRQDAAPSTSRISGTKGTGVLDVLA